MDIFKIAAIAICGVIIASIVREYKPAFALYIVIATVLFIFGYIMYQLRAVFQFLSYVYDRISYGQAFFPILLKVLAVAYIADFVAQICRDSGENAIGDKIELSGKILIFYLATPIMMSVLDTLSKLYSI